jgi:hypothetical protein
MTIPRDLSNLAPGANTSGVLQPSKGGTGLTSPGASGNVLTSDGTNWTSVAGSAAPTQQIFTFTSLTGTFSRGATQAGTYSQTGTTVTVTRNAHGFVAGDIVYLDFTSGTATDGNYTVVTAATNTFTVTRTSATTSGNVTIYPPVIISVTGSNQTTGATVYVDFSATFSDANYTVYQGSANSFQIAGGNTGAGTSGSVTLIQVGASQTWTKPANCKKVLVQLVGGGAVTSTFSTYAGCSGGYSQKLIDVTSVSTVSVTVGYYGYTDPIFYGGTSSFGAYLSATGAGLTPGVGSSGDINYRGQLPAGQGGQARVGGSTVFGSGGTYSTVASGYGAGGSGDGCGSYTTAAPGIVIVTEYY